MNLLQLLDEFDIDGSNETNENNKSADQSLNRKEALGKMGNFGKTLAKAALPFGTAAILPGIVRGQSTEEIIDVLNFALTLEYLESDFYNMGCESGVIASEDHAIFQQIKDHENAHVTYLQDTISSLGGSPIEKPSFDFTAGGTFAPFEQYPQFLALSQAFEDTGVRAYKGQAGNLQDSDTVLTAALRIHSVEGRHAAEVRRLRTKRGLDDIEGWITKDNRGTLPEATQAVYDGEANTTHAGLDVTTISDLALEPLTEGWDEPLTQEQVQGIAGLFIE